MDTLTSSPRHNLRPKDLIGLIQRPIIQVNNAKVFAHGPLPPSLARQHPLKRAIGHILWRVDRDGGPPHLLDQELARLPVVLDGPFRLGGHDGLGVVVVLWCWGRRRRWGVEAVAFGRGWCTVMDRLAL